MSATHFEVTESNLVRRVQRKLQADHGNWQSFRVTVDQEREIARYAHHDGSTWHFLNDLEGFAKTLGVLGEAESLAEQLGSGQQEPVAGRNLYLTRDRRGSSKPF